MANTKVKGINLLPKQYIIDQKVAFYQKIVGLMVAIETICFVLFVALPPKKEVRDTQETLAALQEQLNSDRYAGVNKTLNELAVAKADIQKWISQYNAIKMDGYITGGKLDSLTTRIPSGVTIRQLNITDAPVGNDGIAEKVTTIDGTAEQFEQAISYLGILETLYTPGDITHLIEVDEQTGQYIYNFTITETIVTEVAAPDAPTNQNSNGEVTNDSQTSGEGDK